MAHIYALAGMAGVNHDYRPAHDYGVDGQFDPVRRSEKRLDFSGRPCGAEQIALHLGTAEAAEQVELLLGFDALRGGGHVARGSDVHDGLHDGVADIESAYRTLVPVLGIGAAGIFLLSLIASGVSSSVVGTMAGQVIMQGFVRRRIPLWIRRLVTMAPAFVVVALGVNATHALIVSQVVLSLTLPVPMFALLVLTRRNDVMGSFANRRFVSMTVIGMAVLVLALNFLLIVQAVAAARAL